MSNSEVKDLTGINNNPNSKFNVNNDTSKILTGKDKRRERNKLARQIGTHYKNDNSLAQDIPKISGPIDADRFALARITEINSMQSAIKNASFALNELAFQSLPRGLRRRAASHNLNRLPARLRAKAVNESLRSAPDKPLKRKKVRKIKIRGNVVEEFLRRQRTKKWLETHMWHTKRMKMTDIWGYRIALKPNTKSSRVTYRSFTRLSIVHDASYMGCIELHGDFEDIKSVLNTMTDAGLPSVTSERFVRGNRIGSTNLFEHLGYPSKLICPITFLWKPKTNDTIWLWIHPSAFNEALIFIKKAIKESNTNIVLNNLRDEILRLELTGPRSTALLQAILDPIQDENRRGNQVWKDLSQLRSSCSLSPGSVIGLVVQDPRLKFPQKVPPRSNETVPEKQQKIQSVLNHWPQDIADTTIWDSAYRKALFENKASEYELNQRRAKNLIPGTKLQHTETDASIPLLLIQRGGPIYDTPHVTQKPLHSYELIEGWTIIIPRGYGLAFWKSLVFAGARVGGLDDVRAMHYESGFPCFPHDYPGTRAFENQRALVKQQAQTVWEKKPPAKRINFEKRGVEYPFECAFETLNKAEHMEIEEESDRLSTRPSYSLIQGEALVSAIAEGQEGLEAKITNFVSNRSLNFAVNGLNLDELLIKVRVRYIDRGKPTTNAIIYVLENEEEYDQYTFHIRHHSPLKKNKRKLKEQLETQTDSRLNIEHKIPEKSQHIGYITNGGFSLTLGCGFGIGACAASGLQKLNDIDKSQNRSLKKSVLVRSPSSLEVRVAQLEILC